MAGHTCVLQSVATVPTAMSKFIILFFWTFDSKTKYLFIYTTELPWPVDIVEKLPMVEAIVIGTVVLSVVGRGQHGHLVTVDCVMAEEKFHLFGHLNAMTQCQ